MDQSQFTYADGTKLANPPLAEAWLEIHWALGKTSVPIGAPDPAFAFALGTFRSAIKDRFAYSEAMNQQIPEQMASHMIRYRFRPAPDTWPILQIGPGIAALNYVNGYSWDVFLADAIYLRENLLAAYEPQRLEISDMFLRYRNVEPYDSRSIDVRQFLHNKLNTTTRFPVPEVGGLTEPKPVAFELRSEFELKKPRANMSLRIVTGRKATTGKRATDIVLWDLVVASRQSKGGRAPQLRKEESYVQWLNDAHSVLHEWFFLLIEGELRKKYEQDEAK